MPRPSFRESLGDHPNEGARLLWLAFRERGLTLRSAAALLEVNSGLVSRWLFCDGKPGRALAERAREVLGIPTTAWDESPSSEIDLATLRTGTDG